jgi:acyl transferase domain-containing protein/acyl carrier protein/NAD(P)-dependent dehydrogenase (short-subunit alcohol dehydrogenase family)
MNQSTSMNESPQQPPLAVVGLSALFPKAANTEEFWSNIRRGVDAITEVPDSHWNPDDYFHPDQKSPDMTYARRGGFLSPVPFDPLEFGISPNNLEAIDTSQLLGMVGAKRALEHAGYGAGRKFDRSRVGCILGVTGTLEMVIPLGARLGHPKWRKALKDAGVPDEVAEDVVQRISESYVPWQENSFPGLLGNVVAGRIANRLDLHGTNCVVDAACASSLSAMHLAALELWTGRSDMVVTGGIDTFNDIFMFMCFSKTPALSPTGDSKPFSEDADGTILGEGVGVVVLKRLADAERDGDRIYAVIKGIGTSSDGAGNAVYAPKADGQIRCLQDAYRVSGVSPETIELVEAHGTGTKVGDATEVSGLMQVYKSTGRRGTWCAAGSIKSQIGHTKAAAGAAGVIKAILALQHKILPPTIKVKQPPAALLADDSPFYVSTEARPWVKPVGHPRRAAVSAFGFGGSNFHCVLEESPQRFDEPDWDGDVQIVALSALSLNELAEQVHATFAPLAPGDWPALRRAAQAGRAVFDVEHPHRLLFVIERDKTDIAKLVDGALTMLEKYADRTSWSTPDGAYYGRGPTSGRLGVLFPGQGSQYVGMLRDLACHFPVMNDVLSEANAVFSSTIHHPSSMLNRLSDAIYPTPSWSDAARAKRDAELRATQIAQPAIGAASLGALAVLEQFGVRPEAAAGHSYGELTALCASRRFGPKTLYRLSMLRGRLMAEAQEVDGGMLAVSAPLSQVEAAIQEMSVDLVVANYNSPNQVVLSGRIPEIDRATQLFSQRNLRVKKLPVAAAFHSPLVASASRAFRPELDDVEFAPSHMPVYANSTATEYPTNAHDARDLLASQLARPVNFVREIEQMYADGVRTFLEVGPGGVLTGLVNSILSGREFRAIALDSSNGRRGGVFDLAHALAQLSASGQAVRLTEWDPTNSLSTESANPNRMRIPICGANYVKARTPLPPRPPMSERFAPQDAAPVAAALPGLDIVPERNPIPAPIPFPTISASIVNPPANTNESDPRPSSDALAAIQDNLRTLQRMQEETARLHQQFLESQEAALRTFEELARRQFDLTLRGERPPAPVAVGTLSTTVDSGRPAATEPFGVPLPSVFSTQPPVLSSQYTEPSAPASAFADARRSAAVPVPVSPPLVLPPPVLPASVPTTALAPQPSSFHAPPNSALTTTVLAVVSEKTGYPTEMLNLDMSLDHDLGIDSIKRVEILSALQERVPNLPAFKPEELGALHTLQDVVGLAEVRSAECRVRNEETTAPIIASVSALAPQPSSFNTPPNSALTTTVLAVVSEKTGYPTEMLNLDMSLDHDLGIDSIKRVEILSALQERVPNLPAFKPEELGALHTLQDVVGLAEVRSAECRVRNEEATAPIISSAPVLNPPPNSTLTATVLAVVSEKTGYPTEMLNLDMSLDHDLGIDSIKRVEILSALQERVPNLPAFKPEELGALHTLQDVVGLAEGRSAECQVRNEEATAPIIASAPVLNPPLNSTLTATVLAVVSEKTGYPTEMLNLDMSLDHDLGIDSIKRVEILSALQERVPNLPAFKPEELGALHTLQDVVGLAEVRSAEFSVPGVPCRDLTPAPSVSCSQPAALVRSVVRTVALPNVATRAESLPASGSEIWITEDGLELSLRIAAELSRRGFKPRVVDLDEPFQSGVPERLAGLIVVSHAAGLNERQLWRSIEWLQKAGPALRRSAAGGGAVFATISRLDGRFGFEARDSLGDPVSGGLAGLTKSAAREWLDLKCKAFDVSSDWSTASDAAVFVVEELFRAGPVEIGLSPRGRCTPSVMEESLEHSLSSGPAVQPGDLVVVSGGARGVTAEAALAVARAWRPSLVILGRSPEPPADPEWLVPLKTESEIKQALIARLPKGTLPKAIESQYRQILAGREVSSTLARLRAMEIPVEYHAVDVRDLATVRPLMLQLQSRLGPVRGLIHGAGVLADQRIEDKTREQFDRVYQTKVAGLRNLLSAIAADDLRMLGLFSSYTARYGRVGQCDYAIANEVLNKLARQFAIQHHHCRVASFNWGPWDGGMVTGGLKKLFEAEQVGLIPLADGAELFVQELSQVSSRPVEVLVLGRTASVPATVPAMEPAASSSSSNLHFAGHSANERDTKASSRPVSGSSNVLFGAERPVRTVSAEPVTAARQPGSSNVLLVGQAPATIPVEQPPPLPGPGGSWVFAEIGHVDAAEQTELRPTLDRTLDVLQSPYLESHVIGGKAVMPVAMILEWLAHGAIHRNPGLELEGFDDFRVFQGVRLDRHASVLLRVLVGKATRVDGRFVAKAKLVGVTAEREIVHAAGNVVLATGYPEAPDPTLHVASRGYSLDMATAYATKLFHGVHLQGIAAVEACSSEGIVVDSRTSPAPWAWMRDPIRSVWIADPLAVDAALQAVILWSQEIHARPCLPCAIGSYRQYRKVFPHSGVKIVVKVTQATDHAIRCDVEFLDLQGMMVARMTGCESIADASLVSAFQRNRLD